MKKNSHSFLLTARDKEVVFDLLNRYGIKFTSRGKGKKTLYGKLCYIFQADFRILKLAIKFKPDIFISFASPYAAQISWLLRKPHIAFTDTEHAKLGNLAFIPFSNNILTPSCFNSYLGKNHIKFNSYMELCYLHPKYFIPTPNVLDSLGVIKGEKYIILRFVSWDASHDIGQGGLDYETKVKLVEKLSRHAKVFISSEYELHSELKKYQIFIPPEKMHDVLSFASLYIGEGATMASECAMLGIPAIYVNSLSAGTLEEQEKYGLLYCLRDSKGVLEKALQLLKTSNLKKDYEIRRKKMLSDKIDVTAFMVWFVENYPNSEKIMKEKPNYQYNFK